MKLFSSNILTIDKQRFQILHYFIFFVKDADDELNDDKKILYLKKYKNGQASNLQQLLMKLIHGLNHMDLIKKCVRVF